MNYDIIIENGHVIDGSGNPWFRADVGVVSDRIELVGKLKNSVAERRINAKGLVAGNRSEMKVCGVGSRRDD